MNASFPRSLRPLLAAGLALAALLVVGATPATATQDGWTQIDIWQKGISPTSPYTGDTRTATFDIHVKNGDGDYEAVEISLEMKKGDSFTDMTNQLAEQLTGLQNEGYQFSWSTHTNGTTIHPTDAGSDPDSEGNAKNYPDDAKNRVKLRKETHALKKDK